MAFGKNHSTYMPISLLQSKISLRLDQSQSIVGVFLDLAKAFNTVNHDILLDKLHHYGIRGKRFSLFKSCLKKPVSDGLLWESIFIVGDCKPVYHRVLSWDHFYFIDLYQ